MNGYTFSLCEQILDKKKSITFPLFLFHTTNFVVYLYMDQWMFKQSENAVLFSTN